MQIERGVELALESHPPIGKGRGALIVGHAMMADRRTLDRPPGAGLASVLAAAGFHVYRMDLRGHGESQIRPPGRADWTYEDLVDRDLPAAVRHVAARHPGLAVGIVGHSLTSHAGLVMLGRHPELPVAAFVALAANLWLPGLESSMWRWLAKRLAVECWWLVTSGCGRFPARALGLGPSDVSRSFVRGCLRWARRGRLVDASGADLAAGMARIRIPVLFIAGAADRWLAPEAEVRGFARFLASAAVEHRTVPGDHMGLVTSAESQPMWEGAARWLVEKMGCVAAEGGRSARG